jgi:predicted RNA methylase
VEFVPTPAAVIDKMLQVAQVSSKDLVYDLGCGDGRILIAAAKKYGARGYGVEMDTALVAKARVDVARAGLSKLVRIERGDLYAVDVSPASVVAVYLLPEMMVKLIPQLEKLAPGVRVVAHDADMQGVEPALHVTLQAPDHRDPQKLRAHEVYLWQAPILRKQ